MDKVKPTDQLQIIETKTGVKYVLPLRDTQFARVAGITCISAGACLMVFGGIVTCLFAATPSIFLLLLGSVFEFLLLVVGFRILKNQSWHQVELKNGFVCSREMLIGDLAFSRRCSAREIKSFQVESSEELLRNLERFAPGAGQVAMNPDVKIISAQGENGCVLYLAPFYPESVLQALIEDLAIRLRSEASRADYHLPQVEIQPTPSGVRYILPERDTEVYRTYALIISVPLLLMVASFFLPLLTNFLTTCDSIGGFFVGLLIFAVPLGGTAAVVSYLWKTMTNGTRHEIELSGDRLICGEYILGSYKFSTSCKVSAIRYLSVESFGQGMDDESRQAIRLVSNFLYGAAHGHRKRQLVFAPGYPRDTILTIANDLAQRIELASPNVEVAVPRVQESNREVGNQQFDGAYSEREPSPRAAALTSPRVVDLSTEEAERNVLWTKPEETTAKVYETDEGTVFEYENCSMLRHPGVMVAVFISSFAVMVLSIAIGGLVARMFNVPPGMEGLSLAAVMLVMFSAFAYAVYRFKDSTVQVAIMDGFLMIEEKSKLYARTLELTREDIKQVRITRSKNQQDEYSLYVQTTQDKVYKNPSASREELNWIESEIRRRVMQVDQSARQLDPELSAV